MLLAKPCRRQLDTQRYWGLVVGYYLPIIAAICVAIAMSAGELLVKAVTMITDWSIMERGGRVQCIGSTVSERAFLLGQLRVKLFTMLFVFVL